MVKFTRANRTPQDTEEVEWALALIASQAIQRNWTSEERLERAALAKKQTLKLLELVFGNTVGPMNS